ncbi:hypothetical protein LG307_20030 [Sutcliffiella horikoshii]|uniref:hypothetical protein n=1 Tax=Sutcliffiella horikoshii TaxID=79883 RepID=UPI00384F92DD
MKKDSHIENHFVQGSGFNQTGNIPLLFPIRPNQAEIIFSDETPNHNQTLIQIRSVAVDPFPPFPLQVFIFTKRVAPPIVAETDANTRAFQVEDFFFLAIVFQDEVGERQAAAEVFIQKTFCIDC